MAQSTQVPVEKLLARLKELATQLEEEYKDQPYYLETLDKSKKIVQTYISAYEEGRPFFDRESLADLDRQVDAFEAGDGEEDGLVRIKDVAGGRINCQYLVRPHDETLDTYVIMYQACQHMTHMSVTYPDGLLDPDYPIVIGHTSLVKPSGWSLQELQAVFRTHQQAWRQGPQCESLAAVLGSAEMAVPITKVICFGLGRLDAWEKTSLRELEASVARSATQHAAALTMAKVLARRAGQSDALLCYAQDPIYTDVEKSLLASVGISVINDPKGFLAVDANTLVFSVTPDVPVRQIVADVQWPAAMVWDEIQPESEDEYDKDYRFEEEFGEETRIS